MTVNALGTPPIFGGGVFGKVVGIVHVIITGAGVIITMFQVFILM